MPRTRVLGGYAAAGSWLDGLAAGAKVACLLLLSLAAMAAPGWEGLALLGVALLALLASCRLPLGRLLLALRPATVLLALSLLANGLVVDGSFDLGLMGGVGLRWAGLARAGMAVCRIVLMVGLVLVMTSTTSTSSLSRSLVRGLSPLGRLGLPVGDVAMVVVVALRFIPEVEEEFALIVRAQRARGVRFDQGGPVRRLRAYAAVMIPLVVALFRRSDELAQALRDRCYASGSGQPWRQGETWGARERLSLATSLVLLAAAIVLPALF